MATTLISREPGKAALVGLLSMIVVPLIAFLLMVTIVGTPSGLGLLVVVWPAVAFVGSAVAAIWLGQWLLARRENATPAERPSGAAVVGLLVAFVIGFVPLATAALSIIGLGRWCLAHGGPYAVKPREITVANELAHVALPMPGAYRAR